MEQDLKLLEILSKWNIWGSFSLPPTFPRFIQSKIAQFLEGKEVIILKGIRRAGKSTLFFQIMEQLLQKKIPPKAIFYLNLEEPFFVEYKGKNILEKLYNIYREHIYPNGKVYVFLDEIQEVSNWEKWVRAQTERGEIKCFVTGSSAKLLSAEYGELLTGRNYSFTIWPLDFREFLNFKGIEMAKDPVNLLGQKVIIKNLLKEYMQWGGYPEVVLKKTLPEKEKLLAQYFEDIIYRDIVSRHKLRDLATLKNIALFYLSQMSCLSSYNKIKNTFDIPLEVVRSYTSYLAESYLIKELMIHSYKLKEQLRNPKKIYVADVGLRNVVCYRFSEDWGRIAENLVFLSLIQKEKELFYFKGKQEVDFVIKKGLEVEFLIQVSLIDREHPHLKRELFALEEAAKILKVSQAFLISNDYEETVTQKNITINIIPLWKWFKGED